MAIYRNNFRGGTDGNGTTGRITPANSAFSGDPIALAVDSTAQRWVYAPNPLDPDLGLVAFRTLDGTAGHMRGQDPAPSGRQGMRRRFYTSPVGAAGIVVAQLRTLPTDEANIGSVQYETTRRMALNLPGGYVTASVSPVLPADSMVAIEAFYTPPVAPATTGRFELYVLDDTETDLWAYDAPHGTQANPAGQFRCGGFATSGSRTTDWTDEFAWGGLAEGLIGPAPEPVNPDVYYSPDGATLVPAAFAYSPDGTSAVLL